jgi:acyl-CoA thioester hydrolase
VNTAVANDGLRGARVAEGVVKPEWIDANGHMNVAYYVLAFDHGVDALWESFGITTEYIEHSYGSTFAVESHITYQQELLEGDPYIVTAQILAYDDKRIHQFQRLYHAEKNFLAATGEWMNLHVDLEKRRVSPWPESILEKLAEYSRQQPDVSYPKEAGKQMSVRKPLYAMKPQD